MRRSRLLALPLLLACSLAVRADDWPGPRTREVFSESRDYFVRITPGDSLGDTYGFAGAKKGRYASAEFYRRVADRSYRLVAETQLPHPIAPVEFFVSNDGRLATVDNWHNAGYGKVVSLFEASGRPIRSYELKDLFSDEEIKSFPHSVSSIQWRSGPMYIREDQTTLLLTVRSSADFLFGLASGRFKYCEASAKTFRCRDSNQPRAWAPNAKLKLAR
jgi:hypothetical protein